MIFSHFKSFKWYYDENRIFPKLFFQVAQKGYARSRSVHQWPQSKVNILVLFAIFSIKATET